jgi:hypothetical protein
VDPYLTGIAHLVFFLLLIVRIVWVRRTESSMNADPSKTEGETGR